MENVGTQPQVSGELQRMDISLGRLDERLAALAAKLRPVLRLRDTAPPQEELDSKGTPTVAPLAAGVMDRRIKLNLLTIKLDELIDLIDL